ncbi:MAG: choline kinase [Gammaproteobacteria bacterium]|jgi:choline kinase
MKAAVVAAGIGAAFGNSRTLNLTDILLHFDGRSLCCRYVDALNHSGIEEPVRGVGFNLDGIDYSLDVVRTKAEILPRLRGSIRPACPNEVTDVVTGRMHKHERC